jgi:hypothetical protein
MMSAQKVMIMQAKTSNSDRVATQTVAVVAQARAAVAHASAAIAHAKAAVARANAVVAQASAASHVHDAECALHDAKATGEQAWIDAAAGKLIAALAEHTAAAARCNCLTVTAAA